MTLHRITDKELQKFKRQCEKEDITYEKDEDYREAFQNLLGFMDVLFDISMEEVTRKKRLETEPKGFALKGEGRMCSLCKQSLLDCDGWYDKWGFECMNCQDAINNKKIPGSLCRDYEHKKYITDSEYAWKYGTHIQTVRKMIRNGKIIARKIPNGPYLILRKDNVNL